MGEIIDEVLHSETTQPSIPAIVLDTINDVIMSDPSLDEEDLDSSVVRVSPRKTDVEDQELHMDVADEGDDSKPSTPELSPRSSRANGTFTVNGQTMGESSGGVVLNGHAGGSRVVSGKSEPSKPSTPQTGGKRSPPKQLDLQSASSSSTPSPTDGPKPYIKRTSEERRMPQTPSTPLSPTPTDDHRGPGLYRSKESKDSRNEADRQATINRQVSRRSERSTYLKYRGYWGEFIQICRPSV